MTLEEHRRLDATVAEKVMGWHPRNVGIREQLRFTPPDGESPTGAYPVDVGPGEEWSPSTDLVAAWNVVHRMRGMPPRSLNNLHLIEYAYSRTYAAFALERPEDEGAWSEGNGEHCTPTAICLAALKALGVTVE